MPLLRIASWPCSKVTQAARSSYQHLALSTGAALWRHEVEVALAGENADCRFDAITLLRCTQHGDVTTRIRHLAPRWSSRQRIRSVLAEQATAVFQGLITSPPTPRKPMASRTVALCCYLIPPA